MDASKPKINVVFDQTLERLEQYENAITRYIKESYFTDIVFVENSGYPFPTKKYEQLAEEYGKRFEFLYRELTDEQIGIMQARGKSWGEADLIDYAMCNSKLIAETEVIYKCTGRLFLKHSKKLLKNGVKHTKSQFVKNVSCDRVVTWFFKIRKDDFFKYLKKSVNVMDDYDKKSIEDVWYCILKYTDIQIDSFFEYPRVVGIRGGVGKTYKRPFYQYILADISLKLGMKYFRVK